MNILRRNLAPLTDAGWAAVDHEARSVLETNLATRRFVDIVGPRGWDCAAVNLGSVDEVREHGDVRWALRRVQPLVEYRVPFVLGRWALDDLERGAEQIDLGPVRRAAVAAARFEEQVVYRGLPEASIKGLVEASEHEPIPLGSDAEAKAEAVASAVVRLNDAGVTGPFLLVLGADEYRHIAADGEGYPLRQQLANLVGNEPAYSPGLSGGLLVSTRGGDFPLTLGVDLSIGYDRVEGDDIHLYITESFTFRVTGGEAVAVLPCAAKG